MMNWSNMFVSFPSISARYDGDVDKCIKDWESRDLLVEQDLPLLRVTGHVSVMQELFVELSAPPHPARIRVLSWPGELYC